MEGVAGLDQLQNLDLSGNVIESIDDCEELQQLPSLSHLDMKNNQIDDRDKIVPFLAEIQSLRALYLKGNPCQRHMSMYRKTLTAHLKQLIYLDDRPVFEGERLFADAWLAGGAEAEKAARTAYQEEKHGQRQRQLDGDREKWAKGKQQRKELMQKMLNELKGEKSGLVQKMQDLKQEYHQMADTNPKKEKLYQEMRRVEQDLKSDYIRALEERGEDVASAVPCSADGLSTEIIDKEFQEKKQETEERIALYHRNQEQGEKQILEEFSEGERKLREREIELDQVMQAERKPTEPATASPETPDHCSNIFEGNTSMKIEEVNGDSKPGESLIQSISTS